MKTQRILKHHSVKAFLPAFLLFLFFSACYPLFQCLLIFILFLLKLSQRKLENDPDHIRVTFLNERTSRAFMLLNCFPYS